MDRMEMKGDVFVVWLTGLPGSGKTTIAAALLRLLARECVAATVLSMDQLRKEIFPRPRSSG